MQNEDGAPGKGAAACAGAVENLGARGGGAPPDCRRGSNERGVDGPGTKCAEINKTISGRGRWVAARREWGRQ